MLAEKIRDADPAPWVHVHLSSHVEPFVEVLVHRLTRGDVKQRLQERHVLLIARKRANSITIAFFSGSR